ncbi:hypothetical protein Rhe02_06460 [Rhizocola hellebori]|uniref:Secreted protein n=1 Tax=Rhizocola hellebori TaxID=1392758 RepID=A0A8J3Q2N4_9ACTN|nr:hypothetical protein [Rhizocola hellebori]GIH02579.1 hypothetical protein Rhe02_06460 [Rhizocola hellebori]
MKLIRTNRLVKRGLVTTLVAAIASMLLVSPAHASGVHSYVSNGQTWAAQWLSEDAGNPCYDGDWAHQTMRAEWNMKVQTTGIQVNSIKLTIWNDSSKELYLGRKSVYGGNLTYNPWDRETVTAVNGASWTRTYTVNKFFTWQGGRFVNFSILISVPCRSYRESLFQLEKGF